MSTTTAGPDTSNGWQRPSGGPLSGVRVLDLSQMLAGPYCSMLLSDMGADVIKIEPTNGDQTRHQGPHFADDKTQHFGGYFQSVNRNKASVTLDLKHPAGKQVLLRMVAEADILLENFRVGVMDRLGLGYEVLREHNPRLVYACIRGFGDPRTGQSPYTHWPAYDVVAQAMGGIMGITGPEGGPPLKVGPGVGDIFPATLTALGIVAALHQAKSTGQGQFVDVAMYDSILALCERIVYQHAYTGEVPAPQGATHPLLCPFDNFPTLDGWVTIAAPRENLWGELCQRMGMPELANDARFNSNRMRVRNAPQVRELISAWTRTRTKQQIMEVLGGFVPAGPVNDAADIFRDPHVHARDMLVSLPHPGSERNGVFAGAPIKFGNNQPAAPRRAPLLGEHTRAVLKSHGYTDDDIARLIADGVTTTLGD